MPRVLKPKFSKPSTCDGCPLRDKGIGWVPDKVVPDAEYVFLGEAPGSTEVTNGEPFKGQAGYVLDNWLVKPIAVLQLAKERGKVTVANTLRCLPPEVHGRPYPKGEEKRLAEAHCRQYDNFGNAHTIIMFGESPQRCFFGPELEAEDASDRRIQHDVKGVSGRIGRVVEKDGRRWVFAPHPAWILRQPAIVEHGQQALQIAAQTEQVADIQYVPWERAMLEVR